MTPEERALVLSWSGPAHDPSLVRDELLHELFEASADRTPDAVAVERGETRLTYRELDERANRLARVLRARGVGREDRVALCLPRSERVYEAMLGILKAGAAYVPIDSSTPPDRVKFILEDSGAKVLIASAESAAKAGWGAALDLDREEELARASAARVPRSETGTAPENLAYVIYTSGTTGKPKGVMIEHRNVTNLVRAESLLYGVTSSDRVFQFASASFDASVEEIWAAFFAGAALIAGTAEDVRPGPEFARTLARAGATVLSCVPTFLMMIEEDVPSLRLLILGGESCPEDLAGRWHRPGRTILNTYGPTEATVVATGGPLEPNRPVTIGKPIANYRVFLLDEKGVPVAPGAAGEICIGGPGVARGYLNRPELTAEKFVVNEGLGDAPVRLYRTADRARFAPDGALEYLGRGDDQVKIRGYRVELAEIDAALARCPHILAGAAAVHAPSQSVAAFVVRRAGAELDRREIRAALAAALPAYMVPAFLDELPELPTTSSGKIDRRALPPPRAPLDGGAGARIEPRGEAERVVAAAWESALGRSGFSVTDDFFLDLGGHSLAAATVISRLRRAPGFERASIGDLYARPTVEKLAALAALPGAGPRARAARGPIDRARHFLCGAGQALGVLFVAGLYAWQWLGAFLTYGYLAVADHSIPEALTWAFVVYLFSTPVELALSIAIKWLVLGRVKPGRYPLWGWFYLRYWFVRAVVRASPVVYLDGTPLLGLYYRAMGAKIGRGVFLRGHGLAAFDALTVGDGASVGADVTLDGSSVEDGFLKIAPVTIGRGAWIGHRCSVGGGASVGDGAGLDDLSMLPDGARVPDGERWRGSPAERVGPMPSEESRPAWSLRGGLVHAAGVFLFPFIVLAAVFPGLMLMTHLGHADEGFTFLVVSPFTALSFVALLCAEIWAIKWLLLGRLKEGRYPVDGGLYRRKWFFDQLMRLSLEITGTLYTTLYLRPWLRALGARIGPRSEVSTVRLIQPDLIEAGAECFLADEVLVGAARVRGGWMDLGRTRLGNRTFVGNSAVLPPGAVLGDNVLLGVLAIAPEGVRGPVPDGTSWFGSPAIRMPARAKREGFSEASTYRPTPRLVAERLFVEFFRVVLPSTLFVVLASLIMNATDVLQDYIDLGQWLLLLPFLYVLAGILSVLATAALKWVLVGRYREDEKPLWSGFVWRSELVTGVYENLAVLFFLDLLRGTPFIAWALRLFGLKIGRRCYVDTTWFTEFDLIEIGDEAELGEDANVQTHLFEDRVMKTGRVQVGARATVGAMSTVLYGTELGEGAALGDLSLVMKGESLPPGTRWLGIPVREDRS